MTGLDALKEELRKVQVKISECSDASGNEFSWMKHQHQSLIRQANEIQISIKWMEKLCEK